MKTTQELMLEAYRAIRAMGDDVNALFFETKDVEVTKVLEDAERLINKARQCVFDAYMKSRIANNGK